MTIDNSKLGWLVAAALAGAMTMTALSGFQGNTAPKFATVDMEKVFNGSKLRDTNDKTLNDANAARVAVIRFIAQNPAMNNNDARKYAELAVKDAPTPADTAEIARIKAAGEEATRKQRELQTKNPPTDADKAALADYGSQAQGKQALLGSLQAEYQGQVTDLSASLRDKVLDRVNDVVKNIAAKQGYTVVFDTKAAPYAANDLTAEATKALK